MAAGGVPRVVVTGLGLVTGLGIGAESNWRNLRAGRTAARWLGGPSAGGEAPFAGFALPYGRGRIWDQVLHAARRAFRDARIEPSRESLRRDRAGTVVGFSKGDVRRLARLHRAQLGGRIEDAPSSDDWVNLWPGGLASMIARIGDLSGPSLAPIAACATGVVAVLQAADLIRRGVCDLVVAGAGDSALDPFVMAALRKMKVLARVGDDPGTAVRPCDRRRSGFLPGEGAALLVLEREDHARARGALPYAELAGGAFGADAYHETNLNPDPTNLADLIRRALGHAEVDSSEIDYVNLHGTATRPSDPLECRALRLALGRHADRVSCSANKAQIGHLLGGAGAAELAITCLAIRDGFVPPTLNLHDPDPECGLDATPNVGRERPIRAALKLSIGFGGHLAAAVLRRPEGPRRGPHE